LIYQNEETEAALKMKCPKCQTENPEVKKFCRKCGAKLSRACPNCGSETLPEDEFCGECGQKLGKPEEFSPSQYAIPLSYTPRHLAEKILTSRNALEGERKHVTVFFCDMANSTSLAERIGPEPMHNLLHRFFALALNEVHRYEGTINQFLGDGFMALFGAPIAHEDHASRAVLVALGLQRTLQERDAELGKPYGVACMFRMGLNTGLVVVGSIGDNLRMDYSAIGDTTNLAARLQHHAEPGMILVSESTRRFVQGYIQLEPLPPVDVKGKAEPVTPYKVVGTRPRRATLVDRGERTLGQFAGRERELVVLGELVQQVEAGEGQVVGIVAEAGGGKSRLLFEFRQRLQDRRVTYLEAGCLSYGHSIPYHPIIEIVRHNCGITESDSAGTILEKVRFALLEVGMDSEAHAPYLLQLLGVKDGTEPIAFFAPESIKTRTFGTLKQMSLKGSQQRPLILEVENLHWIDQTSEDFLASFVESLAGSSIMLLTTYRPGYRPPWIGKSYATQIALRRLAAPDASTVVHATRQHTTLPAALEQRILDKAEGNPFFLEELTRAVMEHADFQTNMAVPDTIQDVLMARIDRLSEAPKRLLQTGAVLGREFSRTLLEAIWEGKEALELHLRELKRLEFLFERTGVEEPVYVFKHALTQEVAYESLLTTRRKVLHAAAGKALEALYANRLEDAYDRLAYHYARSDEAAKAVAYLTLVGQKAARNSAYVEASHHLARGLELLTMLPDTPERLQQELVLQTTLGPALAATKGPGAPEMERAFARARDLCRQVGETPQLFQVLWGMRRFYVVQADLQKARELGEQCLTLAQRACDRTLLPGAQWALGQPLYYLGKLTAARAHLEQGIDLYDAQQHRSFTVQYGLVPGVTCLSFMAWDLWLLGYPDQALKSIHDALTLGRSLAHPFSLAHALISAAVLHQFRGDVQAVKEQAEVTVALSTDHGILFFLAGGTILRGGTDQAGAWRGRDFGDAEGPGRLSGHGGADITAVFSCLAG
jgi:class 3 adenylate cyclase/tetratricopeptide (TPR) repeat protein